MGFTSIVSSYSTVVTANCEGIQIGVVLMSKALYGQLHNADSLGVISTSAAVV